MKALSSFIILLFMAFPVLADDKEDAKFAEKSKKFVEKLSTDVTSFLVDKEIEKKDLEKKFSKVLKASFDLPRIGRFVLGSYWKSSSDDQQKEFIKLFESYIVQSYANQFSSYSGEDVDVKDVQTKGRYAFVSSTITAPEAADVINVDWRVRKGKNGRLKIVDVIVEGVSLSLTQREDFAAVIQGKGGDVNALLEALREKKMALTQT